MFAEPFATFVDCISNNSGHNVNPNQPPDNPFAAPSATPQYINPEGPTGGDGTGGLIPYKNPKALIAYYLGILSGLPLIGLPIGIAAFVLGILGLRDRSRNPVIKGSVHAGIGIGCGGFFTLLWGAIVVVIIIAIVNK